MNPLFVQRQITDIVYSAIFGATGDELRKRLGLPIEDTPDDDNLRDHMGIEALRLLSAIEGELAAFYKSREDLTPIDLLVIAAVVAKRSSEAAKREAQLMQIDLLTGIPIEQSIKQ